MGNTGLRAREGKERADLCLPEANPLGGEDSLNNYQLVKCHRINRLVALMKHDGGGRRVSNLGLFVEVTVISRWTCVILL